MSAAVKTLEALRNSGVPLADPKLSPKLDRARAKLLTALGSLSLLDALAQLQASFEGQTTEDNRLANLAAQTWILRRRLEALQKGQAPALVQEFLAPKADLSSKLKLMSLGAAGAGKPATPSADEEATPDAAPSESRKTWQKVRILAESEVNGMVFFEGSTIAVKPEDAGRLVKAGKAEVVEDVAAPPTAAPDEAGKTAKVSRKPKAATKTKDSA